MIDLEGIRSNMYVSLSLRNLKRQKVRTALAAIGIIIGVIAISSMGMLGNGLKLSVTDSVGDIGDKLIVYPAAGEDAVTQKQVDQITKIMGIEKIIPMLSDGDRVDYKDDSSFASVYSIEVDDLQSLVEIEDGRFFKSGSTDCVVGHQLADDLELKVGSKITLDDSRLRVVGILKERGWGLDISADTAVFTSSQMYEKLYDDSDDGYDSVIVKVEDINEVDEVKDEIEKKLNKKDEVIFVFATNAILDDIDNVFDSISLFLIGIGSISLLVAGVSILNVMLMSTMERTKEIGIMKAVGASRKDILKMFLLESLILGLVASLVGGLLTFGGSLVIAIVALKDMSYLLVPSSLLYIIEGIAFGIITSLVGGMYPALKASQMKPLDALRYE